MRPSTVLFTALFIATCWQPAVAHKPASAKEKVISEQVEKEVISGLVKKKVSRFFKMHRKARKTLLRTAKKKPELKAYFTAKDDKTRDELKHKIDKSLLRVQKYFHTSEMCLIDKEGVEIARIVGDKISENLSHNEAQNPFFSLGLNLPPNSTRASPVYLSPDTNQWVIAYLTPIYVDSDFKAILHYEHELQIFAKALYKEINPDTQFIVVVNQEGLTLFDSRTPPAFKPEGDNTDIKKHFATFTLQGKDLAGVKAALDADEKIDGHIGSYGGVGRWTIIGFEKG